MATIGFAQTLRHSILDDITAACDAGAGAAKVRIYDGAQPATGGTVTTLLAELTMSDPSFAAAVADVLTANAITSDASANATGVATWARIVDSDDVFVSDVDVNTTGAVLNLNTTSITVGIEVGISSWLFNAANT